MDAAEARRAFKDLPAAHVASAGSEGEPHVAPLWFVWREEAVYLSASRGSRTWRNLERDPRVSICFDAGRDWVDLAGAVLRGRADLLAAGDPTLRAPMSTWHEKYRAHLAGDGFRRFAEDVADLGFLRVAPGRLAAWDHARA